jgi:hypothetical protein
MDVKPQTRVDTAAKPPGEGAEPKQRITTEKLSSDQQGDDKIAETNAAQQEQQQSQQQSQQQQQPQVPQPHPPLQSVLLPPRMPKHQRKISWDLDQELSPPPPPPPPVSFRLNPKSSSSEQSSALSSSSPLHQPALYSPPNASVRPDSAMTSSPFDLGSTADNGTAAANNDYSSYNESPNNNGNRSYNYSPNSNSSNGSGSPTTSNHNMVSRTSKRKIDLGDLLKASPYESEAETYILSALEDRDPTYLQTAPSSRHRANTGFSSLSLAGSDVLLSRVPEESANMFLEEIKVAAAAAIDTGSVVRNSRNNLGRGRSGSRSGSLSEVGENPDSAAAVAGQDDAGTGTATNATSARTNTTTSAETSAAHSTRSFGRNGSGVLQTGPKFHSESSSRRTAKPSSPARPKHHRQATTTEETLQDLTNALDHVNKVANANHGANLSTSVHGGVQRPGTHGVATAAVQPPLHHNPSSSGGIIPALLRTEDAPGSADALAHNANLLFQRRSKLQTPTSFELDETDSMQLATTPGGGGVPSATRWSVLKAAIWIGAKTNKDKKTDGDDGNVGDNRLSPPAGSISRTDVEQNIPDLSLGVNGNPANLSPSDAGAVNGATSSRRKTTNLCRACEKLRFIQDLRAYLKPELEYFYAYCRAILYIIVPATGIAFILFYLVENPPTGRIDLEASMNTNSSLLINENGGTVEPNRASASWWILYAGVRQVITFSLARAMQVIIVDYFCLGSRLSLSIIGPMLTLLGM